MCVAILANFQFSSQWYAFFQTPIVGGSRQQFFEKTIKNASFFSMELNGRCSNRLRFHYENLKKMNLCVKYMGWLFPYWGLPPKKNSDEENGPQGVGSGWYSSVHKVQTRGWTRGGETCAPHGPQISMCCFGMRAMRCFGSSRGHCTLVCITPAMQCKPTVEPNILRV
jgi:hypothetical protein